MHYLAEGIEECAVAVGNSRVCQPAGWPRTEPCSTNAAAKRPSHPANRPPQPNWRNMNNICELAHT
jgi:hypothetical protein